jgi:hypothetical protein
MFLFAGHYGRLIVTGVPSWGAAQLGVALDYDATDGWRGSSHGGGGSHGAGHPRGARDP